MILYDLIRNHTIFSDKTRAHVNDDEMNLSIQVENGPSVHDWTVLTKAMDGFNSVGTFIV